MRAALFLSLLPACFPSHSHYREAYRAADVAVYAATGLRPPPGTDLMRLYVIGLSDIRRECNVIDQSTGVHPGGWIAAASKDTDRDTGACVVPDKQHWHNAFVRADLDTETRCAAAAHERLHVTEHWIGERLAPQVYQQAQDWAREWCPRDEPDPSPADWLYSKGPVVLDSEYDRVGPARWR